MVSDISDAKKRPEAIDGLLEMLETLTLQAKNDNLQLVLDEDASSSLRSDANSMRKEETETSVTSSAFTGTSASSGGPLNFLKMAFPHYPPSTLREVLAEEARKYDGDEDFIDLEVVVQELLSRELIKELEERGVEEDAGDRRERTHDPPERDWSNIATKQKSRKKSKKERDKPPTARKLVLGDVQQRQLRPTPGRSVTTEAPRLLADVDPWTQLSSLASRLSELLSPLPAPHFLSLFHRPSSGSPSQALRTELARIGQEYQTYPLIDSVDRSAALKDVLDDPSLYDDAELCWHASNEDVDCALELVWLLVDLDRLAPTVNQSPATSSSAGQALSTEPRKRWTLVSETFDTSTDPSSSQPGPASPEFPPSSEVWTTVTHRSKKKAKFDIDPLAAFIPAYQNMPAGWRTQTGRASGEPEPDDEGLTEDQCRYWAEYYQSRRDAALRDASKYWKQASGGKLGKVGGDVAFVYAEDVCIVGGRAGSDVKLIRCHLRS